MEKKMYLAPETSIVVLKDSLCDATVFGIGSQGKSTTDQWSKGQDFDDDEDFDESPWEE